MTARRITRDMLIAAAERGWTAGQAATELGFSHKSIKDAADRFGISLKQVQMNQDRRIASPEEIASVWNDPTLSMKEAANALGYASQESLGSAARRLGLGPRQQINPNAERNAAIVAEYAAGARCVDIGARYGMSKAHVSKIVRNCVVDQPRVKAFSASPAAIAKAMAKMGVRA